MSAAAAAPSSSSSSSSSPPSPPSQLTLYGLGGSQPYRAVHWALLLASPPVPFTTVPIMPGATGDGGARSPAYRALVPSSLIPAIVDTDGFALAESHAILTYLAERHGWTSLYPSQQTEPRRRAQVNEWLHAKHQSVRQLTLAVVAPRVIGFSLPHDVVTRALAAGRRGLRLMERALAVTNAWLVAGAAPTLADLCYYEEVEQLSTRYMNVYDLSPYPHVCAWLERMRALPHHAEAHRGLDVVTRMVRKQQQQQQQQQQQSNL
jgi:glutathione S-transferase